MAQSLLSALARTGPGALRAVWRWYSAQWRREDSLRGKGLLAILALSVLLCPCVAANAFLSGGSPALVTLTPTPTATSTSTPTLTVAPTRTALARATGTRLPTLTLTRKPAATLRPTLTATAKTTATPRPTLVLTVEPTPVPTAVPTVVPATSAPPPPAGGCAYIGNRNSMVFHYPGCSYVARMSESNKVCLLSRQEAIQRGNRPCEKCTPLSPIPFR